jgi:hypothetical protein
MPHRQVDGFARLMIQFLKIWLAEAANIELAKRSLPDGETCNSQAVNAVSATVQKSRAMQVHQEAVHRTDWQAGKTRDLLRSQSARRFAEEVEKLQATL